MDFYIFSVINPKIMPSSRGLNCGYFGTKRKVIGHIGRGVKISFTIFKIDVEVLTVVILVQKGR